MISEQELNRRFDFHPATTPERGEQHELVRAAVKTAAAALIDLVPAGRELATALTKLEEAMFWGNAGVARQQDHPPAIIGAEPTTRPDDGAPAAISGQPGHG